MAKFGSTGRTDLSLMVVQLLLVAVVASSCAPTSGSASSATATMAAVADSTCGGSFPTQQLGLAVGQLAGADGIAASRQYPGVLWIIGEVRDESRLWAVETDTGETLGWATLPAAAEGVVDLAIGRDAGTDRDHLYIALNDSDIAAATLDVLRIEEPDPAAPVVDPSPTTLEFTLSGRRPRATGLIMDGGDLFVFAAAGRGSVLYRAARSPAIEKNSELVAVAALAEAITGAAVSSNGNAIAAKTPFDLMIWKRDPGDEVAATIASAPCIGIPAENDQATAIGFDSAGLGVYTVDPGLQSSLSMYTIPPLATLGAEELDITRSGSVAPVVRIAEPPPGFTVTDGLRLGLRAVIEDDEAIDESDLQWQLVARHCDDAGECVIDDTVFQSGNPVSVTPRYAQPDASEYLITAKYSDVFGLTASDTLVLPFQLPEPVPGSSVGFRGGVVDLGEFPPLTGDMSLEVWVRPADLSARRTVLGKAYAGEGLIVHEQDGRLNYFHGEGGGNCCEGTYLRFGSEAVLPLGVWSHIAVTREVTSSGGTLRFYVDGVQTNSQELWRFPSVSPLPWLIGGGYKSEFAGGIDEVAIYDQVLTGRQISDHHDARSDPVAYGQLVLGSSPLGYWRLDEPAGAVARDETGAWNGTYGGALDLGEAGIGEA